MSAVMNLPGATRSGRGPRLDSGLLLAAVALLLIGLVMVASASVTMADRQLGQPFYYAIRQGIYIAMGLGLGWILLQIKLTHWERGSFIWLSLALGLLVLVLVLLIIVLTGDGGSARILGRRGPPAAARSSRRRFTSPTIRTSRRFARKWRGGASITSIRKRCPRTRRSSR